MNQNDMLQEKTIHYVWVGGKSLPSLAKKCIKSWEKYLPDWNIMEWNESNFKIESSPEFVKQAYKQKKWAFVADYIRTQVLYEHGGLYMDTDMEILGDISKFLEKPSFMGREYAGDEREMVCAGVMYFANKRDPFLRSMLDFYERIDHFNEGLMYSYAIPKIITRILEDDSVVVTEDGVEIFDDRIWVYPKDYFYPVNYDWTKEFYSDNTVMIHHYDASWTGTSNKRNVFIRKNLPGFTAEATIKAIGVAGSMRHVPRQRVAEMNTYARTKASKYLKTSKRINELSRSIEKFTNQDYLIFSNPEWVGVTHVAEDLFGGYVPIKSIDVYTKKETIEVAKTIVSAKKNLIIMNGLVAGWDKVIEQIRLMDSEVKIKILYHGGDSRLARWGDYYSFMKILGLHNMNIINEIGFVKKQQAEFYIEKGYRAKFVANNIKIDDIEKHKIGVGIKDGIRIGLYCSGDIEWKNIFNQVAAASLVGHDVTLDIVPLNNMIAGYADKIGIRVTGSDKLIPRDALLTRMASNDLNMYVTFAEAAPLMPIESMDLGVPCVTANNHHYWTGTPLEDSLIVNRVDDVFAISEKMKQALDSKNKIMKEYHLWKSEYNKVSKDTVKNFLNN